MELRYAAVRALEKADREEFGRILRAELTGLSYAANQVIEREEPEVAAKWFAAELEKQDGSSAAAVFFLVS
jgi:hypothetical protein